MGNLHASITDFIKRELDVYSHYAVNPEAPTYLNVVTKTEEFDNWVGKEIPVEKHKLIGLTDSLRRQIFHETQKITENVSITLTVDEFLLRGTEEWSEYCWVIEDRHDTDIPDSIKTCIEKNVQNPFSQIKRVQITQDETTYKISTTLYTKYPHEWYNMTFDEYITSHQIQDTEYLRSRDLHPVQLSFDVTTRQQAQDIDAIVAAVIHDNVGINNLNYAIELGDITYQSGQRIVAADVLVDTTQTDKNIR